MRKSSLILLSLALAACDSSSGSSSPMVAPPVTVAPVLVIDADNATDVLRVGFRAAADLRALFDEILKIWGADPVELEEQSAATQTIPGPKTGTASFLWEDRDGSKGYTAPDGFLITFEDYAFGVLSLNGLVRMQIVDRAGPFPDAGAWRIVGTIEALGLQVAVGADTFEVVGRFELTYQNPGAITKGYSIAFGEDVVFGDATIQAGASILGNITSEYTLTKFFLPLLSAQFESALDVESQGWVNWTPVAVELPEAGIVRVVGAEDTAVEVERQDSQWIPGFPIPGIFDWRGNQRLIEGEEITETTIGQNDLIEL